MRELSEAVFGQRYRLELMVEIARSDGIVCLTDLARRLDVTASNLQRPLLALTTAGLLSKDEPADSRKVFYRRNASLAWEFAQELLAIAEGNAARDADRIR